VKGVGSLPCKRSKRCSCRGPSCATSRRGRPRGDCKAPRKSTQWDRSTPRTGGQRRLGRRRRKDGHAPPLPPAARKARPSPRQPQQKQEARQQQEARQEWGFPFLPLISGGFAGVVGPQRDHSACGSLCAACEGIRWCQTHAECSLAAAVAAALGRQRMTKCGSWMQKT